MVDNALTETFLHSNTIDIAQIRNYILRIKYYERMNINLQFSNDENFFESFGGSYSRISKF